MKDIEVFHTERTEAFSDLFLMLQQIKESLVEAEQYTIDFYKENPDSYAVVFPTDGIKDLLGEVKEKLYI